MSARDPATDLPLFGRETERARLSELVAAAHEGRSGALLLLGAAGAGKSALCRFAVGCAHDAMTVVTARGVQSESKLAFAGLSELLRPLVRHLSRIPPPQHAALSGALALSSPVAGTAPFVVDAATLSLLAAGAEASGLLAVVDDVQWLDAPSVAALTFAARRIEADGVAMVFAVRDGECPPVLEDASLARVRIDDLPHDAALALLSAAYPQIARSVAQQVFTGTGGNPLALLEVPRTLTTAQVSGHAELDDPLPVGPRLERVFRDRVAAMPEATQRALLVAAASSTRSLAAIVPALADLDVHATDLEPAERAGLVRLRGTDLEFRHPLLRAALYHTASHARRRAAHRALARTELGERCAWHLAAAAIGPDETVATALEAVGHDARQRGGFAAAAAAFARAAEHTREPHRRARRWLDAARDYEVVGRFDAAMPLLDHAAELTADPLMRADIAVLRGRAGMWSGDIRRAHALLVEAAQTVEARDPARAALLHAEAVMACYLSGHIAAGVRSGVRAHELAAPLGGHVATMGMLVRGHSLVLSGDAVSGAPLLLAALERFDDTVPPPLRQWYGYAGQCLTWIEDLTRARSLFDRMVDGARRHSALALLSYALAIRSELDLRTGNWARAYADATESVRLARELGHAGLLGATSASLASVAAVQGRERECRSCARQSAETGTRFGFASLAVYARAALGSLELSLGQPQMAVTHLEPLVRAVDDLGLREPATVLWAPDLIESYVRVGRHAAGRQLLETFAAQAQRTQRRWALAAGARCAGMLTAAVDCDAAFDDALRIHEDLAMPFERARTQLAYGEQLRRANRRGAARGHLSDAVGMFESLGAGPWAQRARNELRATGGRAPRRHSRGGDAAALTPQELQVALAVTQGQTNKEVAAALFLSPKTVEFHLSNAYRKLGVRSRTQLANRLGGGHGHARS